jgi:hypothetical protein
MLSVELPGAKVSLLFRHGDVDVVVSDVDACGRIPDASIAGGFSWHFVIEGRALFEQGDAGWEVLPTHSLRLAGTPAYRVVNPADDHLRLLSVVVSPAAVGESGVDR